MTPIAATRAIGLFTTTMAAIIEKAMTNEIRSSIATDATMLAVRSGRFRKKTR